MASERADRRRRIGGRGGSAQAADYTGARRQPLRSALPHDELVDDRLDVVDAAHQTLQRVGFGRACARSL